MHNEDYLEQLHTAEIEILDEVVRICVKHDIKYCIVAGTLLGAVRHGGFIPWDDDLDIAMPRADLDRFIEIAKTELNEIFTVQSSQTDHQWFRPFAKVRMNNTLFLEQGYVKMTNDFHCGIFIDIFPLDNAKRENGIQQYQKKLVTKLTTLMQYRLGLVNISLPKKCIATLCPFSILQKLQQMVMKMTTNRSEYYVNLASHYDVLKQTMLKTVYFPTQKVAFCGKEYAAPGNITYYLQRIYGENYMMPPPVEKRITHKPIDICFDLAAREKCKEGL